LAAVFFYISGHGFGHASRQIEIVNAVARLRPDIEIAIRTSAARWLFDRTVRGPITLMRGEVDTGVVQVDSLRLDERQTIDRAREFHRTLPLRGQEEAQLLRGLGAQLVVADAPALGCAAAAAAGIPSVVVGNFTWDWIYQAYGEALATAPELVPSIQSAYRTARAAWRMPMHGGFSSFDTIADVPFVARHATHAREDVRKRLGLPEGLPLVLSSFGGYGVQGLEDLAGLDCLGSYGVVVTYRDEFEAPSSVPKGIFPVSEEHLYGSGLRYEDLVAASDIVATKPGYGIISECIANGVAIMYTSRGHFVEYDVLVAEMPRFLRAAYIDHEALFAGRWRATLDAITAAPLPPERPRTDGAQQVAEMISAAIC
jgi:L-arabinokinase